MRDPVKCGGLIPLSEHGKHDPRNVVGTLAKEMRPWENITLRICYIELFPYIVNVGDGVTPKAREGSLFTNISQAMGLKWVRVPSPTDSWGTCHTNGTCTGQLKPLQQETADLALGPLIFNNDIYDTLRHCGPTHLLTGRIIAGFRTPFKTRDQFTFFNIYPASVWWSIISSLVGLPLLAWILSRLSKNEDNLTLAEHWSTFMEIILQEAPSVCYSSNVLRCLFSGWMLAGLVLSSFGNATLKSVMTVLTPQRKLETFEDVLKLDTNKVTVRALSGSGTMDSLAKADPASMRELAAMVVKSNGMIKPAELMNRRILRELETMTSILILNCEVAKVVLYWPPAFKLDGTQGYTYCGGPSLGIFISGWAARRNAEPIYGIIFDELSKRARWWSESPLPHLLHYETESPMVAERYIQSKDLKQPPPTRTSLAELSGTFILYGGLVASTMIVFSLEMATYVIRKND